MPLTELPPGISGLSRGPDGLLWLAPERRSELWAVDTQGTPRRQLQLMGLPPGRDVESIAWLDPAHVLLGTEGPAGGLPDQVLVLRVDGDLATLQEAWTPPMEGPQATNQGLEALCVRSDGVLAVSERVVDDADGRWAPWALRESDGTWRTGRFSLTTDTGKVAALACTGSRVVFVERHYGVGRLVEASLEEPGAARVLVDLGAALGDDLPNLEGLELRDGGFWVATDNQHGRVDGPGWLLQVPARPQ